MRAPPLNSAPPRFFSPPMQQVGSPSPFLWGFTPAPYPLIVKEGHLEFRYESDMLWHERYVKLTSSGQLLIFRSANEAKAITFYNLMEVEIKEQ